MQKFSVLLINQAVGMGMQVYPCSGKSNKLYGNALLDPSRRGVVLKMSLAEYEESKLDLVGNTQPGQQWIPEFVVEAAAGAEQGLNELVLAGVLTKHEVPTERDGVALDLRGRIDLVLSCLDKYREEHFNQAPHKVSFPSMGVVEIDGIKITMDLISGWAEATPEGQWFRCVGANEEGVVTWESRWIKAEDAEALARTFHNIYEQLAPKFGYETRAETKQFDPTTPNGQLMIAVCGEILAQLPKSETVEGDEWKKECLEAIEKSGIEGATSVIAVVEELKRRTEAADQKANQTSHDKKGAATLTPRRRPPPRRHR